MSRDLVGATLGGRYQLTALVGRGGMGAVYEAREMSLGRIVAIKVLSESKSTPTMAERFYREAVAAARLQHVNIIQVTDFSPATAGAPAFMVMERLHGMTLSALLARARTLQVARAMSIGAQIASALAAAHGAGVIHRDIKPDNLFVQDLNGADFVKVFDFGIAKVVGESNTTTGAVLGTVSYMSPEQAMAAPVGPPADVWSIGVVLYQMLSGRLPITHRGLGEIVSSIMRGEMVPVRVAAPGLHDSIATIIERSLARDPHARFRDARELFDAIQRARDQLGIEAAAPTHRVGLAPLSLAGPPSTVVSSEELAPKDTTVRTRRNATLEMPQAPKRPAKR